MNDRQMLTVDQAAERLKTVRNLIGAGRLGHYRIGAGRGVIRISEEALDHHFAECEVKGIGSPASPRGWERREFRHIKL